MAIITVAKPFTLQLEPVKRETVDPRDWTKKIEEVLPSETLFFPMGIHEVEDRLAEHWYVKAHLKGYVEPPRGPGTAEYQMAQAQKPRETAPTDPTQPTQPMPSDASEPRMAALPPTVRRMEPLA
jgi:hypothetical protein